MRFLISDSIVYTITVPDEEYLVGGKWSTILGMGMEFFWVAGWLTLAVIAYFIRYSVFPENGSLVCVLRGC